MTSLKPTDEQSKIISASGNVVVLACPGSGKTFTISRMIAKESEALLSFQGVIAISYTRKASAELEDRCRELGVVGGRSFFGTIDSFSYVELILPFVCRNPKWGSDVKIVPSLSARDIEKRGLDIIVDESLRSGTFPLNLLCDVAVRILRDVPAARRYVAARYTTLYVDEYQDCGATQHELVLALARCGLRVVVVGDSRQSIFRFADKHPCYLEALLNDSSFSEYVLTANYRSHPSIIAYSRILEQHAENVRRAAAGASEDFGQDFRVFSVSVQGDESAIASHISRKLPLIMDKYDVGSRGEVAILARSNHVLERLSRTLAVPHRLYIDRYLSKFKSEWSRILDQLLELYFSKSRFVYDFVDTYCLYASARHVRSRCAQLVSEFLQTSIERLPEAGGLVREIIALCRQETDDNFDLTVYEDLVSDQESLVSSYSPVDQNQVNLLTYHKAKGLEFDVVFCLETYKYIMPPYNSTKAEEEESLAIHYVGVTRARKACYLMVGTRRHNAKGERHRAEPSMFLEFDGLSKLRANVTW